MRGRAPPRLGGAHARQRRQAQHPRDLGRRHRDLEPELLQRRPHGLPDAEHRPDRGRGGAVHGLLRRAELHGGQSRLHLRAEPHSHGPDEGGHAGGRRRHPCRGPDHCDGAQGPRLRHRAVRQEPPRRPRRAPAHRARLRRVLRQPVPPQRGGGAGAARLPDGAGLPELPRAVRAAWRHPLLGQRGRHPADRGHRPPDQEAHGDRRRRVPRRGFRVHQGQGRRRAALLPVVQHHAHALPHARETGEQGAVRAMAVRVPRRDDRPRQSGRGAALAPRRAGHQPRTRSSSTPPTTAPT